jgi:hypothetical protein
VATASACAGGLPEFLVRHDRGVDASAGPARRPPEEGEPLPTPESLLPVEYSNPQTSELTANVTREGENHFPFELTE